MHGRVDILPFACKVAVIVSLRHLIDHEKLLAKEYIHSRHIVRSLEIRK